MLDIRLGRAGKNQQKEHIEKIPTITCGRKSITQLKYSYCVRNSVKWSGISQIECLILIFITALLYA